MLLTLWDKHFSQNSVTGFILTCTSALHFTAKSKCDTNFKAILVCFYTFLTFITCFLPSSPGILQCWIDFIKPSDLFSSRKMQQTIDTHVTGMSP